MSRRSPRVGALELPGFALQIALRDGGLDPARAVALIDSQRGVERVLAVTPSARRQGPSPGQTAAQARALLPTLSLLRHDPPQVRTALIALAEALSVFAPVIELASPQTLLLDASAAGLVGGQRSLFDDEDSGTRGGRAAEGRWATVVLSRVRAFGVEGRLAVASAPEAARLVAMTLVDATARVLSDSEEADALVDVGLDAVQAMWGQLEKRDPRRWPPMPAGGWTLLPELGVATLGAVRKLPAGTLSTRLGAAGDALSTLARGGYTRPLDPFVPEERLSEQLSFDAPVEDAQGLVFALRPGVERLAARLEGRGLAATRLVLGLVSMADARQPDVTPVSLFEQGELRPLPRVRKEVVLDLARPAVQARALLDVLRDRLATTALESAVVALDLGVDETTARTAQLLLGQRPRALEALDGVLARLQARLGSDSVGAMALTESWLPEEASQMVPFRPPPARAQGWTSAAPPRETAPAEHLLDEDEPLEDAGARPTRTFAPERLLPQLDLGGRLDAIHWRGRSRRVLSWTLPEKLSTAWWATPVQREYATLLLDEGQRVWVFRDEAGQWWAQGVFD